jgi:DNA-directed RNA polymerase subunit omega
MLENLKGSYVIMMIDPPIDELKEKVGNEYLLANLVAKRAKELEKDIPDVIEHSQDKAITLAAREIYSGKVVASKVENSKVGDFGRIVAGNEESKK